MDTTKVWFLGYIVLIVVQLSLSHPLETKAQNDNYGGLPEYLTDSTELVDRCKKIDDKALNILCQSHCSIKRSQESTDISQIYYATWVTSKESFMKNPNRCDCCKPQTPSTEKPTTEALPAAFPTDPVPFEFPDVAQINSNYPDASFRFNISEILSSGLDISSLSDFKEDDGQRITTFDDSDGYDGYYRSYGYNGYAPGAVFIIILAICIRLCLCYRVCCRQGQSVVITRRIFILSNPSGDSSQAALTRSEVEPNKDNPPSYEDIVSKPATTSEPEPAPAYEEIVGGPKQV